MKPRARRVTIGAVVLGALVVAVLVVANWGTVRDHVEGWHFQLTHETATMEPVNGSSDFRECLMPGHGVPLQETHEYSAYGACQLLAKYAGRIVVFPSETQFEVLLSPEELLPVAEESAVAQVQGLFITNGFRVLEQRFPRRAYVVIRDPHHAPSGPTAETLFVPTGDPVE